MVSGGNPHRAGRRWAKRTMSATETIDRETFHQYVYVQRDGQCNMLDQQCVRQVAAAYDFDALLDAMDEGNYSTILQNYAELHDEYGDGR